uniref:MPN domain-containing protein n=1 Tax=Megaselia scalaris TaxID=36166 RepID=T1GVP6_MEGSC
MQEVKELSPPEPEATPLLEEQLPKDVENDEEDPECFEGFNGSGRTVTLQNLLAANILHPEKASMTIEYLGQKFVGDLLPDGKIKSHETETIFLSPSSWAMHCKRIINPEKKSGCGWASVKYKGKKLDAYKAIWLKKCAQQKEEDLDATAVVKPESPVPVKRMTVATIPLPFLLTISSNALLVADLHCHLTLTEVCGYFGGSWDINTHTLTISKAYPGLNSKADRHKAGGVEEEIKAKMQKDDLIVVGWYHCHPRFQAAPTLRDCDTQLDFQIRMRGPTEVTYTPIIGSIFSPYDPDNKSLESVNLAYWVTPPPESKQTMEYGRPMTMLFTISPEKDIPSCVKEDIIQTVQYYQEIKEDMVDFNSIFRDDITFIEKLKASLYTKFPHALNDKEFWNWLCGLLNCEVDENEEFVPPKGITKLANPIKQATEMESDRTAKFAIRNEYESNKIMFSSTCYNHHSNTFHHSNAVSVSPRDSPITIPSNSESPAKFEIPVRASPSPAKSDVSNVSNRTKNSPAPSPGKFSISEISRNSPSVTPHSISSHATSHPSTTPSLPPPNDIMTASLAQLAGQLPPSILQNSDFSTFFKQARKDYGNSSLNQLAAAAAKAGAGPSKQSSSTASAPSPSDLATLTTNASHSHGSSSGSNNPSSSSSSSKKQSQSTRNFMMSVNSYKTKLMKELDDIKNDPIKISELMRSPEYASLLLQQAEALGATTLGSFGLGPDFSFLAGMPNFNATKKQQANPTPPPNQMQQLQQEYAQLLQSSKLMGYDSYLQQAAKVNPEVNAYIQQQIAAAASALGVTQKPPLKQLRMIMLNYLRLNSELSALLSAGMPSASGGGSSGSSGGSSKKKSQSQDSSHHHFQQQQQQHQLNQQNEMLNQLLQADKAQSELNALLCHQNKAANELNALFAQTSSSNKGHSSSSQSTANAQAQAMADAAAYYNAISGGITQDKWQEYAKLFAQSTNAPNFGMPDPLSKSTLAANNFFMSPPQLAKFQQDSLNAMMMKPPKSTSSRVRESSASPAPERLTPTKPSRIDSPAAPKYNFSAADLAVSSVPSNTPSPAPSDGSASSSSRRPINTPPIDLARLYPDLKMSADTLAIFQQKQPKKRMEFSSIADLAAPPPAKMSKLIMIS